MRQIYVMRDGELILKSMATPKNTDSRIHVIGDAMPPMRHMATGRIYDSKSKFRADTRAMGCVEVGNDPAISRASRKYEPSAIDIVNDVRRAIAELQSR